MAMSGAHTGFRKTSSGDNFDDFGALYTEATDDIVFRGGEVALDVSAYEEFGDRRIQVRG